jgi:hypothetical protein
MPSVMVHTRKPRIPSDPAAAFGDDGEPISTALPPRYDRPVGAANNAATSPVTNQKTGNDQEMQSGADEMSGVHASSRSGGDYSREQGVGRSPGFRWPFNFHSAAFDFTSLDRWAIDRTGAIGLPPNANPYEGVPERQESPIASMDQLTTYYENDPDQWYYFSPPPMTIPEAQAPSFTEQAVLGRELGFE